MSLLVEKDLTLLAEYEFRSSSYLKWSVAHQFSSPFLPVESHQVARVVLDEQKLPPAYDPVIAFH
jgi:hypothetical protein